MSHAIRLAVLLALLCPLVVPGACAAAGGAPDSAQRAALQERIGRCGRVRILGTEGPTLLLEPVVREDGLHMRRPWKPPRAALFVSADAPTPPRPAEFVAWSTIEGVQVRRSAWRSGALTGAVLGGAVVSLSLVTYRHQVAANWEQSGRWIMAGSTMVVVGTTLTGFLLGSVGEEWRTVWPSPPPPVRP
jgi:hypothetical protein